MATTVAVIVAAGRGTRAAGSAAVPKQYAPLAGVPVLAHSLRALCSHPQIDAVLTVIHEDDRSLYEAAARPFGKRFAEPVAGGATRQESVRLGLEALTATPPRQVLIHDAARPLLTADLVTRLIAALGEAPGAIAAEPLADTLKRGAPDGTIAATVERDQLWRAQTPQAFHFEPILEAHRRAAREKMTSFTDDAGLAEWAGLPVKLVASSSLNMKLTTAQDIALAERILAPQARMLETRTGSGFDVHAFCEGDHVWLGGVKIAHDRGLSGHSDADVALHALTDAILGAIGDGDIGEHFPPTDPEWRGAPSRIFLEDAVRRVRERGGRVANVDITLLCEAPKIGPHRPAMRAAIAEILGLDAARVGIKATTTEGLGFLGRREGIAALASATIVTPF
jgi:2-C-methyl-D-erythritol 4-phosphate cytidylyltransferase/2-C-methyl-D-erythritol 2,4-cyclodiphosphate synthase